MEKSSATKNIDFLPTFFREQSKFYQVLKFTFKKT